MRRGDVEASRDLAKRYVKACDELLALEYHTGDYVDRGEYAELVRRAEPWTETAWIAGRSSGAHRRLSLDLTRALAHMRRRT